jgi:hypothetical protein
MITSRCLATTARAIGYSWERAVTDTEAEAGRLLWFEELDFALSVDDAADLEEHVGIRALALDDPDEWVLGYKILGTANLETATILYMTRRLHAPGVRFDMKTMAAAPPDTEELHELVKRYIREFSPIVEARQQEVESTQWHGVRSVVMDYRAREASLRQRGRAHVAQPLHFDVPVLATVGLGGYALVDLAFPPEGDALDITIGLGIGGPFDRVTVRAAIGDQAVTVHFTSAGVATIRELEVDPNTDLLHLTFEVES